MKSNRPIPMFTAALLALLLSGPAFAGSLEPTGKPGPTMKTLDEVEPRIPISQSDIPLTVTQPGSYYLTGNITCTQTSGHAISIACDNVTLDLMGYTISGTDVPSVDGINAGSRHNVEIRNGTVRDFDCGVSENSTGSKYSLFCIRSLSNLKRGISLNGSDHLISGCIASENGENGISCGADSTVSECRTAKNGLNGIEAAMNCAVHDCIVSESEMYGIAAGNNSIVRNCLVKDCRATGIKVGLACQVINNACQYNNGSGIHADDGSVVSANAASHNGNHGIFGADGCTITCNSVYNNSWNGIYGGNSCIVADNTVYGNLNHGITVFASCQVNRNTARENNYQGIFVYYHCTVTWNNCYNNGAGSSIGAGIRAISGNRIESNQLTGHNIGIQLASDKNLVVKNTAQGNATTLNQQVSGNKVAPWASDPTTAGPWDNFSF